MQTPTAETPNRFFSAHTVTQTGFMALIAGGGWLLHQSAIAHVDRSLDTMADRFEARFDTLETKIDANGGLIRQNGARIDALDERVAENSSLIIRNGERIAQNSELIGHNTILIERNGELLAQLRERVAAVEVRVGSLEVHIGELDVRVGSLEDVVRVFQPPEGVSQQEP